MFKKTAQTQSSEDGLPSPHKENAATTGISTRLKSRATEALLGVYRSLAMRYGNTGASERIARVLEPLAQSKIISGPFQGMRYVDTAVCSALSPKLIGSYEQELEPVIQEIIERAKKGVYSIIIDIGSAEGYYAVGFASRCPDVEVLAFEGDDQARQLCLQMAEMNDVGGRVQVKGYCEVSDLQKDLKPNAFVLCDCEGSEVDLLDPTLVPALLSAELIVELHDFCRPNATRIVTERFAHTHEVTLIDTEERSANSHECLRSLKKQDQILAMKEYRPGRMQWAWMKPRA